MRPLGLAGEILRDFLGSALTSDSSHLRGRFGSALTWTAVFMVIAAYVWTFFSVGSAQAPHEPPGYYGLLTDALLSGHFSLKVTPDPRLAELSNPWASYQGIPRLHDATYYHGRYYIYFGVTPVIILFAPWRITTGTFLTEGAGVCLFGMVGFLLGLDVLRQMAASRGYRLADRWRALGVLVWGFCTFVFVLMQSPIFYSVPIASAFACLMAALAAVGRTVTSREPLRAAVWLGLASLSWGLAVGSRPNYILGLPAIVIPLAYCVFGTRGRNSVAARFLLVAAAILPAAIVGACLAWYNFSRFGSVSEFGIRYQFAASDQRFIKLWSAAFVGPNVRAYLMNDGLYLMHFPFFVPTSAAIGIVPWMPFTLLGAFFPLLLISRSARASRVWVCISACTLAAGVAQLAALCMLPFANDRYIVDFAPEWTLLALAVSMALIHDGGIKRLPLRRLLAASICLLAAFGIARAWMLVLDRTWDKGAKRTVAVASERVVSVTERILGIKYGPLRLEVNFKGVKVGSREALLETGGGSDGLFVERVDATHLRLAFVHRGNMPIIGIPFPFDPEGNHVVQVNVGSLYPPDTHPFFKGWDKSMIEAIHRGIRADIDGTMVLMGNSTFYPTDAAHVVVGRDTGLGLANFSGSILGISVGPVPSVEQLQLQGWRGPVRLKLRFPAFGAPHSEPLVSSGAVGASDMIYVTYLSPKTLRFGHDSSDGGSVETPVIEFDPLKEHTLDISYDALYQGATPSVAGVVLKFDDEWKLRAMRSTHSAKPYEITFGYNAYGLSTASETFSGTLVPTPIGPDAFVRRLLQRYGSIEVGIQFVQAPARGPEPLLSSGIAGRGDVVFVRYVDKDRVSIGIDHWGIGSVVGTPITVNRSHEYRLQVSSAAFLPPEGSPDWGDISLAEQRRRLTGIRVRLDGVDAVAAPWDGYPSNIDEIAAGVNAIGASSCGPVFSGKIVSFDRIPLQASH